MPLNRPELTLGADPRSAQEARRWVSSLCAELGREDLIECAELGVSELVTNALLHAGDPISVRVRGTREHPRVEVADGSHHPPVIDVSTAHDFDDALSTFGRGLKMVAQCSVAWGAAIEPEGKVVWFEPARSIEHEAFPAGSVFDLADIPSVPRPAPRRPAVQVSMPGVPVHTLLALRRHYNDLRREVRLLSLAHEEDYPLAKLLTDLFSNFDHAFPADANRQINTAAGAGHQLVDLAVAFDPESAETFETMVTLLDLADEFCRGQRLLSLARSPEQVEFQHWFLGEFVAQSRGAAPRPWAQTPAGERARRSTAAKHVS